MLPTEGSVATNSSSAGGAGKLGGTMRLGAYDATLRRGNRIAKVYGTTHISERHRHRYEVNMRYRTVPRAAACDLLVLSHNVYCETVEYPDHPWFIGVQYHPELKSRPLEPPAICGLHRGCRRAKPAGLARVPHSVSQNKIPAGNAGILQSISCGPQIRVSSSPVGSQVPWREPLS